MINIQTIVNGSTPNQTDTRIPLDPLNMNLGSTIFKVISQDGVFVDRYFDPLLSPKEIENELCVTLWASQHEIAPKVHTFDKTHMIMDWINGKHIQELSVDQIQELGVAFRNMHALLPPDNISQPKNSRSVDGFLEVYSQIEKYTSIPSYLTIIKSKLLEDTKNQGKFVLTHGDIHAYNVLWTNDKLFMIDWTCAGLDYPIMDLSIASMFWGFSKAQDEYLMKSYFGGEPEEANVKEFNTFKNYAKIHWAMWPIRKIFADFPERIKDLGTLLETRYKNPTRFSFEEYRIARFNGSFMKLMNGFDDWIDLHLARIHAGFQQN